MFRFFPKVPLKLEKSSHSAVSDGILLFILFQPIPAHDVYTESQNLPPRLRQMDIQCFRCPVLLRQIYSVSSESLGSPLDIKFSLYGRVDLNNVWLRSMSLRHSNKGKHFTAHV